MRLLVGKDGTGAEGKARARLERIPSTTALLLRRKEKSAGSNQHNLLASTAALCYGGGYHHDQRRLRTTGSKAGNPTSLLQPRPPRRYRFLPLSSLLLLASPLCEGGHAPASIFQTPSASTTPTRQSPPSSPPQDHPTRPAPHSYSTLRSVRYLYKRTSTSTDPRTLPPRQQALLDARSSNFNSRTSFASPHLLYRRRRNAPSTSSSSR